ncbi:MAG: NUDIX hydrolase [Bacteroidales bacterium]|nr:NUDIX hydrolase [Bacteroidales bacterium]
MVKTTVGAIITNNDKPKKLLLTKRAIEPFKGYWCFPGGHIDEYEKAENAVIREVKEETGLDFKPSFVMYSDEIIPEVNQHAVVLIFQGTGSGELLIEESEVLEAKWFNFKEARELKLAFGHNQILDEFLRNNYVLIL